LVIRDELHQLRFHLGDARCNNGQLFLKLFTTFVPSFVGLLEIVDGTLDFRSFSNKFVFLLVIALLAELEDTELLLVRFNILIQFLSRNNGESSAQKPLQW